MIARVWRGATRAEDDRWLVERDLRVRHYEVDAVIDPSVPWDSSSGPAR